MSPETTILYGDAWELASTLEPASIDCIVTSPPYWGLRDYGHPDQFGLERTPQEYVAKLVELFARLRPALKDQGTLWLNLGDSYNATVSSNGGYSAKSTLAGFTSPDTKGRLANDGGERRALATGLKPKDLVGIPWRVAFALQEDGWYLRSDIIWAKKNCMPESVTDRPTKAHEYVFLLAKSERYYFDMDAVREPHAEVSLARVAKPFHTSANVAGRAVNQTDGDGDMSRFCHPNGRNIRTVWTIATKPYSGAHFATMPPDLAERCIKAGTSERGVCPTCGRAWERDVEMESRPNRPTTTGPAKSPESDRFVNRASVGKDRRFVLADRGWKPTCDCGQDPIPATVLDPFVGSGTTLYVARKLGRNSIGFELNKDYRPLIEKRLAQGVLI